MPVPKAEAQRRMQRFVEACHQAGMRVTYQRTEIFRQLASSEEHPDAEMIYRRVHRRIPAVSLDTVYRTLRALEELHLVRKAEVHSGSARYDANPRPHHHFLCTDCGLVRDVYSEEMDRVPVPASVRRIGRVTSRHVQLLGTCTRCAARKSKRG